jgi:hypothetical protein
MMYHDHGDHGLAFQRATVCQAAPFIALCTSRKRSQNQADWSTARQKDGTGKLGTESDERSKIGLINTGIVKRAGSNRQPRQQEAPSPAYPAGFCKATMASAAGSRTGDIREERNRLTSYQGDQEDSTGLGMRGCTQTSLGVEYVVVTNILKPSERLSIRRFRYSEASGQVDVSERSRRVC